MPILAETNIPDYSDHQVTIDLMFAEDGGIGSQALNRFLTTPLSENQDYPGQDEDIDTIIRQAVRRSPLSVVDATGSFPINADMIAKTVLHRSRGNLCFTGKDECARVRESLKNVMDRDSQTRKIDSIVEAGRAVQSLLISLETIIDDAKVSWVGDKTGDQDFIYLFGAYPGFKDDYKGMAWVKRADIIKGQTGLDPLTGPVYGYAGKIIKPDVTFPFIAETLSETFLNEAQTLLEQKSDAIDWANAWEGFTAEHGRHVLDHANTATLQAQIVPVLDGIVTRLQHDIKTSRNAEFLYDRMQSYLIEKKPEIDAILSQWNDAQPGSDMIQDRTNILTIARFQPGTETPMDVPTLLEIIKTGAQNGIKAIEQHAVEYGNPDISTAPFLQHLQTKLDETWKIIQAVSTVDDNIIPFPHGGNVIPFPRRKSDAPDGP